MANEVNQLSAEHEEFNNRIENAKSEEEAADILNEYFSAEAEELTNSEELSEEQLETVAGGHVLRRVERNGVPVFNKPGGKIVAILNIGDEVVGATAITMKYKQNWFRLENGNVVNAMHLSKWQYCPRGQH